MSGLILQPCRLSTRDRQENFLASVARLRTVEDLQDLVPAAELAALQRAVGDSEFSLWGAKIGRQTTFDKIAPGMRCLFIGDKKAYADLTVLHRFATPLPRLARAVWPSQGEDGEPWELVMALSAPRPIDLDYAVVKSIMKFDEDFVQQKLFVYTEASDERPIDRLIARVDATDTASEPMWASAPRRRRGGALAQLTSRDAVLAAIRQFDNLGREQFLELYGFGPARTYLLRHDGRNYDSKAIVGVAFGYQFPERGPLKSDEFSGGEASVRRALERLEFDVVAAPDEPLLAWFAQKAGQEVARDDIRSEHGRLIGAQGGKVIFKPAGSDAALSIQVLINSPYGPEEVHQLPSLGPDGDGWLLRYHREQQPDMPDTDAEQLWTNKALEANMATGQPVGVLIQTQRSPSTFLVQGLGYVVRRDGRRFWVASHNNLDAVDDAVSRHLGSDATAYWHTEDRLTPPEAAPKPPKTPGAAFDPATVEDERERARADIVRRQGQGKFRADVLLAYGYQCAVTDYDVEAVLEAAHILPYRGPAHHDVRNGILLRSDLHTLMDRNLLRIHPDTRHLILHESLKDTPYWQYNGTPIREPADIDSRPHRDYLAAAWDDGSWEAPPEPFFMHGYYAEPSW